MKDTKAKGKKQALVRLQEADLGMDVDVAETLAQRGIDTGERVRLRKPEIHRAACKMLGYGIAPKMVEELLGLDIRIVLQFLAEGESDGSIPLYKERTLKQLRAIVTLGLDALIEKAKEGKIDGITMCALIDKAELLAGNATSRSVLVEDPRAAAFRRFMEQAAGGMVTEGREISQRAPAAAGPAPAGPLQLADEVPLEPLPGIARDKQSPVFTQLPVDNERNNTR